MRALLYLEWRYARNQIASILRSPWRLGIWIPYSVAIGLLVISRTLRSRGHAGEPVMLAAHDATGVAGLYAAMVGIAIVVAGNGRIAGFRSRAEAVLLANAGIRPIVMAMWLQGRRLLSSAGRYVGTLAYVFLIWLPRDVGAGEIARAMFATLLAMAIPLGAELPVFLLARGRLALPIRIVGVALAAAGLGCAAVAFLGLIRSVPFLLDLGLDPGRFTRAVLAGDPAVIVAMLAIVAISAVSIRALGNDALPELYAMSQIGPLRAGRPTLASARRAAPAAPTVGRGGARVPHGALAMIWKDWVGFKRGRAMAWLWIAGAAFWAACGIAAGDLYLAYHLVSLVFTLVGATALLLFVGTPSASAIVLANDLGKPIFWLSRAPLRARIVAWTFARTWRGATAIALGPLAAGIVMRDATIAIVAVPIVFATFGTLQALGLGLYAFFPNPLDSRGPMVMLRLLATAAFVVPAVLVGIGVRVWLRNDTAALLASSAMLGLEGWIVVELASLHFAENGAAIVTISQSS